ncbi:hypothetical protein I79_018429 [Cricetulus griseus]|uniref:Uncharacterized protein n=1 Tax=Cricetulus griseus TaxID=10029 RepID=G3I4P6_CRIGR|nr:hypothetical protein I79_018429 [Cricetulus griseus]
MQVQIAGMMFGFRGPSWTEPAAPPDQPALRGPHCCHGEMQQQLSARWSTTDFFRPTQEQTALF